MSNIPVNPTVLALSLELKDGAGKLYRLKVEDGTVTFCLLDDAVNKASTSNESRPAPPIRSETVAVLIPPPPPADSSDDSESTNVSSDEDYKVEAKLSGSTKGATNRGSHANTKNSVVAKNPVAAKNQLVVNKNSRATTKITPATSTSKSSSNNKPPRATKNRACTTSRQPPKPIVFSSSSDEDDDYATGAASQEFFF